MSKADIHNGASTAFSSHVGAMHKNGMACMGFYRADVVVGHSLSFCNSGHYFVHPFVSDVAR